MGKKKKTKQTKTDPELVPSFASRNCTDTQNGLYLMNTYIPEEIVLHILSFVAPEHLLQYSLVCRKWNQLIKSYSLWSSIYQRNHGRKAKKLPWYLYYCELSTKYFDTNLLRNGNGQNGLEHWECKAWEGDRYVEDPPRGVDPLPEDVPEFNLFTSCFTTTYFTGSKSQLVMFGKNKLFHHVLNKYKPYIYLSEWTTGNFESSSTYELHCGFIGDGDAPCNNTSIEPVVSHFKGKWKDSKWKKVELLVTEYPDGIQGIIFKNSGHNTHPWKGHSGIKMAGGVVKLLFDSIEPLPVDEYGNEQTKSFSKIQFISSELPRAEKDDELWNGEFVDEIYYPMA